MEKSTQGIAGSGSSSLTMADHDRLIVETDLTQEETAICEAGAKEYREHPENFISLDNFIAREQTVMTAIFRE